MHRKLGECIRPTGEICCHFCVFHPSAGRPSISCIAFGIVCLAECRSVYRLLSSHEHSIGLWRHSKAEQGLLLELYWDSDCIAGTELLYENMW